MFAANLRTLREAQGISQKDLAARLGQKTTTYQGYEQEKSEPSIAGLCKLADFFGISIDELVGHADPNAAGNEDENEMIIKITSLIKLLDEEDKEKLYEIAKAFVALQNASGKKRK